MLALLEDREGTDRCPVTVHSEYFSEGSDSCTFNNSPASSCIEDYNVAAEVEISRDISDHQECSFFDQCLANLEGDFEPSGVLPWANLSNFGDTITEFALNEYRNRQTEGGFSQCENVCSDDYWNRCNSWVNSTSADVKVTADKKSYGKKTGSKSKRKCSQNAERNLEKLSWNEMTVTEQQGAVESLTHIVSSTMGLREQLDVIRILNPKAVVSATDTEFEIDLDLLNADKLERIREYVKQHQGQAVKTTKSNGTISRKTKRKNTDLHHRRKGQQKATKEQSALLSRVYKQLLKEKRSGLFHNEQVISISKTKPPESKEDRIDYDDDEDEIEIDILD